MSFGKNDANLSRIGTYGATTSQQMGNAVKRQSGPRRGPPVWANNFQPSESAPDTIRLIPGDFEAERIDKDTGQVFKEKVPWFEYTEHFHGGIKKSMTCSGGIHRMSDRKRAEPCRGCDIWREDADERRRIETQTGHKPMQPNRVSFSGKYAFIALDMGWFFKGYRLDEHGRPKVGNNGQAYMDWIKYNDQNYGAYTATQQALASQNKAVETQQGLIRPWPVGFTQFNTLISYSDMIQKHCRSCGGMNCVHIQNWACPHCSAPTFQGAETTMPADKMKEVVNGIIMCRNCKQQGYPKAVYSCQHCTSATPATLYDVDISIQTLKVNKTSQLHLAGVSPPKPLDGVFNELLKKLPDIEKKFSPTPYDEQVAIFGPAKAVMDPIQQPGAPGGPGWGPQAPTQQAPQGAPAFNNYGYQQPQQPAQQQYAQQPPQYQQPYPPAQSWTGGGGWNNGGGNSNG